MKTKNILTLLIIPMMVLCVSINAFAHGGDDHHQNEATEQTTANPDQHDHAEHDHDSHGEHENMHVLKEVDIVDAKMSDFSSLHPLVVHFPIVLLLLAFIAQVFSLFLWKKQLDYLVLALLFGGVIGAYLASGLTHPHTAELSPAADEVLQKHELFASYTFWLSLAGLVLKLFSKFIYKNKVWLEIIIAIVLAGAAGSISKAGHYGATLTHIHGVGAQGNFIELGDGHDHSH